MLMRKHGIRTSGKKRFKVTTDSNHDLPIAANLLDRQFIVQAPDTVWAGDTTYIATDEGWLFLGVVVDLFSRQNRGDCDYSYGYEIRGQGQAHRSAHNGLGTRGKDGVYGPVSVSTGQ